MRRIAIVLPDLLGEPSFVRQKLPALERIAEHGTLMKLGPMPEVSTREALYLGMGPDQGQLAQGPLTVSALGADPPPRSTHFHLSLMSYEDGIARRIRLAVPPDELRLALELAQKLNTKQLTLVPGAGVDHGLVWENLGDLKTYSDLEVEGNSTREHLPQGDAEVILRRYIDDSINLLSELEFNERRRDEELPPLNLLWPWGEGIRLPVPNLALRRGDPALVLSSSLRMEGLARLVGYRHGDRAKLGVGTNVRFTELRRRVEQEPASLVLIEEFERFRSAEKFEEGEWLAKEMETALITSLVESAQRIPTRIAVVSPSVAGGLAIVYETRNSNANAAPFDERALEDKLLPRATLWEAVDHALT